MNNEPEGKKTDNEDFAALLDAYDQITRPAVYIGEKITAKVIAITRENVFLDVGSSIDGVVTRAELLDEQGQLTVKVGDMLELYVTAASDTEIQLSRSISGKGSLDELVNAFRNKVPVEGKVQEVCKGGFAVDIMKFRAFCPVSQMDVKYIESPEDYIGQIHHFRITRIEDKGRNIVITRRGLLEEAQKQAQRQFLEKLQVGDMIEGTVTRLMPYGAFVELIAGLEGMIHISELCWSRVEKPDEVVQPGDRISVKVIDIQPQSGPEAKKIALSAKQIDGDPWERLPDVLQPGAKVTGRVTRCAPFGAFVEVFPGIEGLVHISEMSFVKRILRPEEIVTAGETVSVMIKSIDPQNRKMSLSLRDAEGDPWLEVPQKYRPGQKVTGQIEKKETFGYLVALEPGVVGLLPASHIHKASQPTQLEKLKQGDAIPVAIQKIDAPNRRISLLPADSADSSDWHEYQPDTGAKLSPLAEKLQAALAAQKKPK